MSDFPKATFMARLAIARLSLGAFFASDATALPHIIISTEAGAPLLHVPQTRKERNPFFGSRFSLVLESCVELKSQHVIVHHSRFSSTSTKEAPVHSASPSALIMSNGKNRD